MYSHYSMLPNDDILNEFDEMTFLSELVPLEPPNLCPISNEITSLNTQLERLSLDVRTQSFRVAIERAKRQKLGTLIRKVKRDLHSPKYLIDHMQSDITDLHRCMADSQRKYDHKISQIATLAYRSLTRMHQLLITFTPYIPMTVEAHVEVFQLNYEFYRTTKLLKPQTETMESLLV